MVVCGIDVGARTAKAVVLVDGEIAAHSVVRTGPESAAAAVAALERSLETTALRREDIEFTVATGYGRVVVPFAQRNLTEIACHARGNHHFFPGVRTILDMGGQDCKVIRCDETGKVTNFLMNDKCAAGTGRALEVMASLLQVPLEDLGRLSLEASNGLAKISNTCVIFAKSEVLALARCGIGSWGGWCLSMGDYVQVRPIRRRHPALGSAQRPFVLATLTGCAARTTRPSSALSLTGPACAWRR